MSFLYQYAGGDLSCSTVNAALHGEDEIISVPYANESYINLQMVKPFFTC